MITHIDVSVVLRRSVCDLYSNLVTRPTGAAVRAEIELQLASRTGRSLTVIDFANVALLDFSCADEVVAKLILKYSGLSSPAEAYFLFRGMSESHLDAIEAVLERHSIAIVSLDDAGHPALVGPLTAAEREVWEAVCSRRRLSSEQVRALAKAQAEEIAPLLDSLYARRLLMRLEDEYVSLGELLA